MAELDPLMPDPRFLQEGFDNQLAHFIEECGEALAAAGKTQRWGPFSYNPDLPPDQRETNIHWLLREMDDVSFTIDRLRSTIRKDFHI